MATFTYVRPDEWFGLFGAVTGAVDSTYFATSLVDGRTGRPARLTGSAGAWTITGAAQDVDVICIGHHLLDGGTVVNITGGATTTVTIPTHPPNGIPLNGVRILGATATAVTSLTVTVAGQTSGAVIIGEVCAGKARTLPRTLFNDTRFEEIDYATERAMDMAYIPPYDRGMFSRVWSGTCLLTTTQLDSLRAWWQAQRATTRPSLIIPDTSVNDAWFVRFEGLDYIARGELRRVTMTFREYPRSRW